MICKHFGFKHINQGTWLLFSSLRVDSGALTITAEELVASANIVWTVAAP